MGGGTRAAEGQNNVNIARLVLLILSRHAP